MKRALGLDLLPVTEEELSPQAFIDLVRENPRLIARSRITPPQLGKPGFGSIRVTYSRPQYKAIFGEPH